MSNTISSKDLDGLSDLLTYEESLCKKFDSYSKSFTDPSLQQLATQIADRHRARFNCLWDFLNGTK